MPSNNKKKVGSTFSDCGSFKQRRSSLRVNLSCSSVSENRSSNGADPNKSCNKWKKVNGDKIRHDLLDENNSIQKKKNEEDIRLFNVTVRLSDINIKGSTEKKSNEMTDIRNDSIQVKKCFIQLSRNDKDIASSPILSGSNKIHTKQFPLKPVAKTMLETHRIEDKNIVHINPRNKLILSSKSTSILNMSDDEVTGFGLPLTCSTFIRDQSENERCVVEDLSHSKEVNRSNQTENIETNTANDIRANITNICSRKHRETATERNLYSHEMKKASDKKHIKNMSKHKFINDIKDDESNRHCGIGIPERLTQTSLTVNTSFDKDNTSVTNNVTKEKTIAYIQDEKRQEDNYYVTDKAIDILPNFDQESRSTIRSSLQVNTSLDSVLKSPVKAVINNKGLLTKQPTNQIHSCCTKRQQSADNTNSPKKLKSLVGYQIGCRGTLEKCHTSCTNVQSVKDSKLYEGIVEHNTEESSDISHYIKSTVHTEDPDHSAFATVCEIHKMVECTKRHMVNSRLSRRHFSFGAKQAEQACNTLEKNSQDPILLDDTPYIERNNSVKEGLIFINDTPCNDESVKNDSSTSLKQPRAVTKVRGKKRLLPLYETSQLVSLTPIPDLHDSPKQVILKKKQRKKGLKFPKKKPLIDKINILASKEEYSLEANGSFKSLKNLGSTKTQNKKQKKLRNVISKKIVIKKFANIDVIKDLEKAKNIPEQEEFEILEHRNSLNEFHDKKIISSRKHSMSKKMIIVTTGLSKEEKSLVKSVVNTLGAASLESNVTRRTTHVVCSGVRSINLLHGIIRGCWLVGLEWIVQSCESKKWLEPEGYEIRHFSKAVYENRRDRQLFGAFYVPELFAVCGPIYIESSTTPPAKSLKVLIQAAGGHVTEDSTNAKITIGAKNIKESWVLDSIVTGELQPFDGYKRK